MSFTKFMTLPKKIRLAFAISRFRYYFSDIMRNVSKMFLPSVVALLLAGCADFLAVSGADTPEGGLYQLHRNGATQIVRSSKLNCLVRDESSGRLYGCADRQWRDRDRTGAVVVIAKVPPLNELEVVQTVTSGGRTPCHVALSPEGDLLYCANYSSGSFAEMKLADGKVAGRSRIIRHTGGSVKPRQKSPHPHFVGFDPAGKRLFVCDLGCDRIFVYDRTPGEGIKTPAAAELVLPPGSGPRHLVFAPDGSTLYVANELDSTVMSFVRDKKTGNWRPGVIRSTLPAGAKREENWPGAIKIADDGRHFFVANRGDDSVAVFSTAAEGEFRLERTVPSGGEFPSDLLLLDGGSILAVGHQKGGGVTAFDWDAEKRTLTPAGRWAVPKCAALCK